MARRHVVLSVVTGLALLLLAGCGTEQEDSTRLVSAAVRQLPVSVNAAEVADLGRVLTNQDGRTLYLFTPDNKETPTCLDVCAQKWPPLLATGAITVTGAAQDLVDTVARPDGTEQVTVGGWPVYTFAQDTAPGQANGQGAQGMWFAVTTQGKKAGVPIQAAVRAKDIPGFGEVLTDQEGHTLYLFTLDNTAPSRAACEGECAQNWPPLLTTGDVELEGVDPDLLGQATRADGARQVTVGGWPVYTYVKDTAPGQTTGHGASGVWFAIEPAGCKSTAAVSQPPAAGGPDGSTGY